MQIVFLNNFDYWKLNSDTHECIQIMSQLYSIKCYLQTPLNYASFHFSTQWVPRYHKIMKFSTLCILMLFFVYFINYSIEVQNAHRKMKTHKCRAQWIFKTWRQACDRHPRSRDRTFCKVSSSKSASFCLQNPCLSWTHQNKPLSGHKVGNSS